MRRAKLAYLMKEGYILILYNNILRGRGVQGVGIQENTVF